MSTEKEKTKERYYIYSHSKKVDNYAETRINNQIEENMEADDKIRKIRSSSSADRKQVSRNISLVLENLLMSYENSQLPTHGEGIPTKIRTNILIRSMGPVSEKAMDYSMDCYFRQYWRDKRLSFKSPFKSLSLSIKMLERMWKPDTYFYNAKKSHIHTITVPNKLLRLTENGDILYSMRLTIRASCPMQLRNFPMDRQSCPLILGSYAYTNKEVVYEWYNNNSVSFDSGMALSQFDLISFRQENLTLRRREGDFSTLQVLFNLQRHTGYFLIQVYVPCILIVILSWVSFWIHREATSDRVGLGITTVLTLSTISLDSRTDLPKVRYATALDWFLLMSFFYCIATLLEFAGVHYFTKVGSGEIPISDLDDDEWEDVDTVEEIGGTLNHSLASSRDSPQKILNSRLRNSMICPIYNEAYNSTHSESQSGTHSHLSTMERTTQTEPPRKPKWKQVWLCFIGDDEFRKQRAREANAGSKKHVNSVSLIDRAARVFFPTSFGILNLLYWLFLYYHDTFHSTLPA
ncbi:gamma-aminobutyric acid receptor subunit alpha-1 isoform X5 [Chironomus tepperi]